MIIWSLWVTLVWWCIVISFSIWELIKAKGNVKLETGKMVFLLFIIPAPIIFLDYLLG